MSTNCWKMFALDFAYLLSIAAEQLDFDSLSPQENWSEEEFREFVKEVLIEVRTVILTDESGED